jgi:hypothetical protein
MLNKLKSWFDTYVRRKHWHIVVFNSRSGSLESQSYRSFCTTSRNFTHKSVLELERFCEQQAVKSGRKHPEIVIKGIFYLGKMTTAKWNK